MVITKPFTTFLEPLVLEIVLALLHHEIVDNDRHLQRYEMLLLKFTMSTLTVLWMSGCNISKTKRNCQKRYTNETSGSNTSGLKTLEKLKGKSLSELAQILVTLDHM